MKSLFTFLLGGVVGAAVIWFGFSKNTVLLPSGTSLIEIDRFSGAAREVPYATAAATQARYDDQDLVAKIEADWEKKHPSEPAAPPSSSSSSSSHPAPVALSTEDLAKIKFSGSLDPQNPNQIRFSIYNGTDKRIAEFQIRVEGTNKQTGFPVGRNVSSSYRIDPGSDLESQVNIENGYLDSTRIEGLKITLAKVMVER